MSITDTFTTIHDKNVWGSPETTSGPGSEAANTVEIKKALKAFIKKNNVHEILDIGCGDFSVMRDVLAGNKTVKYTGIDVVPDLIVSNNESTNDQFSFATVEAADLEIPHQVQLVLCRHVFQHLPVDEVRKVINKIINVPGERFFLATTFPTSTAGDTHVGGFFPYNLELPEFGLGEKADSLAENNTIITEVLGVWAV